MEVRTYECFLTRNSVFPRGQIGSKEDPEVVNILKALWNLQIPTTRLQGVKTNSMETYKDIGRKQRRAWLCKVARETERARIKEGLLITRQKRGKVVLKK